ncbi:hypothetical protein B0H12DRAFT_339807 [Mycena haematopus]|nr:hypothetical protein B0H12DRAFT_339807 [Mycena haematopus]
MRLVPTLVFPALITAFLPLVSAHARPGGSLHSSHSRSLSRLQYHQPRDLLNLCVNIPETIIDVLGPDGIINILGAGGVLNGLLGIDLDVCLCIDNLDIYLKANVNVTTNGQALAAINALIDDADNTNAQCDALPAHATRRCTTANPCGFDCTPPYTLSYDGTQCHCYSCPSSAARSMKSRRTEIYTYEDAKDYCAKSAGGNSEVCGVFGKPRDWECIDVTSSPDSCGGCVIQPPFPATKAARGIDCGSMANGENLKCQEGKCVAEEGSSVSPVATNRKPTSHKSRGGILDGLLGGVLDGGSSPVGGVVSTVTQALSPALGPLISNVLGSAAMLSSTAPSSGCVNASGVSAVLLAVKAIVSLDPLSIVADVKLALGQVTALHQTAQQCSGAGAGDGGNSGGSAGSGNLLATIGDLLNHLLNLQNAFPNGVAPTVPSTPAEDQTCFVLDLCALLEGLGPIDVCGGLGQTLHDLLQNLVDGLLKTLGLDPNTCPRSGPVTPLIDLNLKRRAFRTRSGHFARTDVAYVLSPDITPSVMRALTITTAITNIKTGLPSTCESLLPTLGRLFASSSLSALQMNLIVATTVTQLCKDSLAKSSSDTKLTELVELLLPALLVMRENKSPSVAQSTECPSADATLPICRLRMPISDFIRCSCRNQQLPDDTQEILDGPIPAAVPCSSVLSLPATSVVTRSTVPAAVSPSPSDSVAVAASALLTACLKANLLGGNMPFKTEAVQKLNSGGMNPLLTALVGSDLLKTGPDGTLGGVVAEILLNGNKHTTTVDVKQLVANAVSLVEDAKGSSDCKCSKNADKLIAALNQLPVLVDNLQDAVGQCACAGAPLLDSISGPLSKNPRVIKAFQLLNA